MSKFSTGWRVGDAGFTVFGPPNGNPAPEVIANVKKKENSRLISAAPDLLEACRAAIQLTVCNNAPGSKMVVKEMLRKAINKAVGGENE